MINARKQTSVNHQLCSSFDVHNNLLTHLASGAFALTYISNAGAILTFTFTFFYIFH